MAFWWKEGNAKPQKEQVRLVPVWLHGRGAYAVLLRISVYSALKWVQDARVGHRKVIAMKRQHVGERICCGDGTEKHVPLSDHILNVLWGEVLLRCLSWPSTSHLKKSSCPSLLNS